jgi:hypothetical protein
MANPQLVLEGVGNAYLSMDFEIITATMEGKYLGSTHFEAGKYDPRIPVFGTRGIYFPLIHPEYPDLQEDQIQYDVFQVVI